MKVTVHNNGYLLPAKSYLKGFALLSNVNQTIHIIFIITYIYSFYNTIQ